MIADCGCVTLVSKCCPPNHQVLVVMLDGVGSAADRWVKFLAAGRVRRLKYIRSSF